MYKNLRIVFTVLSAICLAAAIPLGMFFGLVAVIGTLIGAGVFFFLMLLCKQSQESAEKKQELSADLNATEQTDGGDSVQSKTDTNQPRP